MKLHYPGSVGGPFGWGVFGLNITRELGKLCELTDAESADVVIMPLANESFAPAYNGRSRVNVAVTFFESPLGPDAERQAKKYDAVFAGSTWCLDRMKERGITNGRLLIQGVDRDIFKPLPPRQPDGQFRIFSGGKFEYRKGQDLVIAAFKEFSRRRENVHLVCSWFNPWPHLMRGMFKSEVIDFGMDKFHAHEWDHFLASPSSQIGYFSTMLRHYKMENDQCLILGQLSQSDLAREMSNTDVGLFPNRCEGGTNLVLMEYASCGRKVIANTFTGHHDVAGGITFRIRATEDANHWALQSVEDIVEQLELAYTERHIPEHWGMSAYRSQWTWEAAARKIVDTARSFLESPQSQRKPRPSLIDLAST